jgi:hypothetical protein
MDERSAGWKGAAGIAGLLLATAAQAQLVDSGRDRGGLGLQPSRVQYGIGCGASLLPCASEEASFAAARDPAPLRWSVELATVPLAGSSRTALPSSARQGLNLSLVGRKPVFGSSFSVYGRLGATYATPDTGPGSLTLAGGDSGGMSFGAGVSVDLSPRLSATFGWDSYDLRLGPGPRENLRATSLGLQYRY